MAEQRFDKHGNPIFERLFESNYAQIGSLGDIVENHGGEGLITAPEKSVGGADGGESDFIAEMNPIDPSGEWEGLDDEFPATTEEDGEGIGETDLTGTAAGIARGFGSHLPLDFGKDGFQIEELPPQALNRIGKVPPDGVELDDYDEANADKEARSDAD